MMKKSLAILLAVLFLFALAGCVPESGFKIIRAIYGSVWYTNT